MPKRTRAGDVGHVATHQCVFRDGREIHNVADGRVFAVSAARPGPATFQFGKRREHQREAQPGGPAQIKACRQPQWATMSP